MQGPWALFGASGSIPLSHFKKKTECLPMGVGCFSHCYHILSPSFPSRVPFYGFFPSEWKKRTSHKTSPTFCQNVKIKIVYPILSSIYIPKIGTKFGYLQENSWFFPVRFFFFNTEGKIKNVKFCPSYLKFCTTDSFVCDNQKKLLCFDSKFRAHDSGITFYDPLEDHQVIKNYDLMALYHDLSENNFLLLAHLSYI